MEFGHVQVTASGISDEDYAEEQCLLQYLSKDM